MDSLRKELTGLGLMAAGSLCIGLLGNGLRQNSLSLMYAYPRERMGRTVERFASPSATPRQRQSIELDGLQERVSSRRGLIIDARPAGFYQAGHIPGAINLPREDFEKVYPQIRILIGTAEGQEIIVYCSEADCRDSELVAEALSRLGYRHLLVYKEGWAEWTRAGLPQEKGLAP